MSLQAVLWALYDVPKEKVKGAALRVLLTLADHAATPAKPPHRHTWKCSHTLQLLHRQDDEAAPDDIACTTANALNAGIDADQVTQAIDTGNPSTLQDLIWESA